MSISEAKARKKILDKVNNDYPTHIAAAEAHGISPITLSRQLNGERLTNCVLAIIGYKRQKKEVIVEVNNGEH